MNLRLPAERELPQPDRMVDRILADTPTAAPSGRHRARLAIAVAAAVAMTAAAILGIRALPGDRVRVGQPPVLTASPQPPRPTVPPITVAVGATVSFPDLTVTVSSANQLQVNNRPADEYTISVTTCVRGLPHGTRNGKVPLREDSFTVDTGSATITVDDPIRTPVPLPKTYSPNGSYAVGQCVSGVIPFGVDHGSTVVSIDYANAFGDSASWFP